MSEHTFFSAGLTEESLRFCMPPKYRNLQMHIFDTLDSTNGTAKDLAQQGAPHGSLILSHQQTGGRGRLGRSFFSPLSGIYLSVLIRPSRKNREEQPDINRLLLMTSAAAVAVADSIEEICGKATAIKWVNDIYVDEKKVCGILTEAVTDFKTGQVESLVIGIGINTSLEGFPPELLNVAGALGGDYDKAALTASVVCRLLNFAEALSERGTVPSFMETYRKKSLVIGKTVTVYKGVYHRDPSLDLEGRPAKVLDIDDAGGLCVIYTDGTRETLTSGEISIRF